MKEILLTKGYIAFVDDDDYEKLNRFSWHVAVRPHTNYAGSGSGRQRNYKLMHNLVLATPAGMMVDHIDRNGLNNQKSNLRLSTRSQNFYNSVKRKGNRSGFKGVLQRPSGQFYAAIGYKGKKLFLGNYPTAQEAAVAYNKKAVELAGAFARLNEV